MALTREEEIDAALETQFDPGTEEVQIATGDEVADFVQSTASMSFETKVFAFRSLLDKASSVIPTKDIAPVLKNFLVELSPAPSERLRVIATDLDLATIAATGLLTVHEAGTAVFPASRMLKILAEAEDGEMLVDVKDGIATLTVGRAQWTLRLMDGSDYPGIPEHEGVEFQEINRVKFLGAISSCRYAAATDAVRPPLMMLHVAGKTMTACDGVRVQQISLGDEWPEELEIDIPIGAVDKMIKLLHSSESEFLGIHDTGTHLMFRVGADVFIASKLMATFPDVADMLLRPALANSQELDIDRAELDSAIKRVRITADPETSAIILDLGEHGCVVRSKDRFGNECREEVSAQWTHGDRQVVVNHKFLSQMLAMADVKSCRFFLGEDTKTRKSPVMLKDDETGMVGLIQQMRPDWTVS